MNKRALSLAVFIAGAYPAASSALGLGDIQSNSNLNQPLRATIGLSAAPADPSQIQVRLAPPEVFNRVGVARPEFLNQLRFRPTLQNGKPVILVTSDTPIQEPFVNFLLEVTWPKGQLLKEYTVMLDPPVLMQPGNTVAGEAAVRAEPKAAGNVRRPSRQAAAPRQAAPAQQAAAPRNRTYRVKQGDTLFKVASRLQQPGVSNDQMMMALFRANPNAFIDGNINSLRAGVSMKAPSAAEVGSISRAEARRQIRQQNAEWRELRKSLAGRSVPQQAVAQKSAAAQTPAKAKPSETAKSTANTNDKARLEVLGAKNDAAAKDAAVAAGAAGSAKLAELEKQLALANEALAARQNENNELKSRVSDLETMLSKKNRLLALRDSQLADMQQKLSANGIQPPVLSDNPDAPNQAPPTQPSPVPAVSDNNTVLRGDVQPEQNKPFTPAAGNGLVPLQPPAAVPSPAPAPAPVAAPVPTPTPAAPVPAPTPTPVPVPVKPAVVPVTPPKADAAKPAPVFADQADESNDLLGLLTSPLALQIGAGSLALLALLWLLGRRRKPEEKKRVAGTIDDEEIAPVDHADLEAEVKRAEGRIQSSDDPFGLDARQAEAPTEIFPPPLGGAVSDDCLEEANVYIAYGLYQQAEGELKKCIERKPEKLEYRHKLLECYFTANNRESFDLQAQQFAALHGANKETLWKEIAEWGRKISPDNRLYREELPPASSVAATVSAALGGAAAAVAAGSALAATTKADEPTPAVAAAIEPDVAAVSESPFFAEPTMSETAGNKQPAHHDAEDDFNDLDLGDLDFDDLDLDKLLNGDTEPLAAASEQPVAPVVPARAPEETALADLPELPELADIALASPSKAAEETAATAHETFELNDLDDDFALDFDLDDEKPAAVNGAARSEPVEDDNLLDFSLDDDGQTAEPVKMVEEEPAQALAASPATNLNLHLDNNTGINRILPKDTFYAPISDEDKDWLGDIDDALSFLDFPDEEIDLHEAHISTKLDLARAYLDMGDIEGARSTLEEVMVEGNDNQRREAEVLLHQTG